MPRKLMLSTTTEKRCGTLFEFNLTPSRRPLMDTNVPPSRSYNYNLKLKYPPTPSFAALNTYRHAHPTIRLTSVTHTHHRSQTIHSFDPPPSPPHPHSQHKILPVMRTRSTQPNLHQQPRSGQQMGDIKSVLSVYPHSQNMPSSSPGSSTAQTVPWRGSLQARNRPFLASHDDGSVHGSSSAIRFTTFIQLHNT